MNLPKTSRAIGYILLIGGSFNLGIALFGQPKIEVKTDAIVLKEFAPILNEAINKEISLNAGNTSFKVKKEETTKWIEYYVRSYSGKTDARISYAQLADYLESIGARFNVEPINAKFGFGNDERVDIFVPSALGKKLNIARSAALISDALLENKSSASLVFDIVEPEITLEKINNLGINKLLGAGASDYGKSPASRIHNIKVGMSKFNGIILKPGEEFSFNKFLGEVDEAQNYQAELVIKNGELEREYGGGLCQVSTTVFRAAIMAGLPITERKPHSFPVQYYNPQGFDSTIYPGIVDLKFINDTPAHILIQTKVTGSKLSVEIYGSDDGRKVTMEEPVQYDRRPSGAMKAYFVRKIALNDGTEKKERFDSAYKAPPPHPLERNPLE